MFGWIGNYQCVASESESYFCIHVSLNAPSFPASPAPRTLFQPLDPDSLPRQQHLKTPPSTTYSITTPHAQLTESNPTTEARTRLLRGLRKRYVLTTPSRTFKNPHSSCPTPHHQATHFPHAHHPPHQPQAAPNHRSNPPSMRRATPPPPPSAGSRLVP